MSLSSPDVKVYVFIQNGKYGVRDDEGWEILSPIHDYISIQEKWILVYDNIRYEWRSLALQDRKIRDFVDGTSVLYNFDGSRFILSYEGKPLKVSFFTQYGGRWDQSVDSPIPLYHIQIKNNGIIRYGVIDDKGRIIIPPIYSYIDCHYPLFKVYLGGEYIRDSCHSGSNYVYCDYVKGGKWKIIDVQTKKESTAEYEVCIISNIGSVLATVLRGDKLGFLMKKDFSFIEDYRGLKPDPALSNKRKESCHSIERRMNLNFSPEEIYSENVIDEEENWEDDYHDSGWTQSELDDMYRAAFDGEPSAQWNID